MKEEIESTMDVTELQVALAEALRVKDEALREKDKLQSKLNVCEKIPSRSDSNVPCYILERLPRELRDKIYGYLLIDDKLSGPESIPKGYRYRAKPSELDLTPALLQTCRQIYEEASLILYQGNTFFVDFTKLKLFSESPVIRCAIQLAEFDDHETYGTFGNYSAMKKVRHWKIMLSPLPSHGNGNDYLDGYNGLVHFCRAIRSPSPLSLRVFAVPETPGEMMEDDIETWDDALNPMMRAFEILRNVGKFQFKTLQNDEQLWRYYWGRDAKKFIANAVQSKGHLSREERYLQSIVQGNGPVMYTFKMYENLLEYARAFERCPEFKQDMHPIYRRKRERGHRRVYENIDDDNHHPSKNPFRQDPLHPVEKTLEEANMKSMSSCEQEFKDQRKIILEYLEPQYRRIVLDFAALTEFIKTQKREHGIFDARPNVSWSLNDCPHESDYATALILLDDLALAFARDMPPLNRAAIRLRQDEFFLPYKMQPREIHLEQLNLLVKRPGFEDIFQEYFQTIVDEMECQYLEIRKARRKLFDDDAGLDYGCDIDPEKWRYDGKTNWNVNEPDLSVQPQPKRGR